jgi:hypothetical protein
MGKYQSYGPGENHPLPGRHGHTRRADRRDWHWSNTCNVLGCAEALGFLGVRPKDDEVIKRFARVIRDSVEELTQILHTATISKTIELKYYRGKTLNTVNVTPTESPKPS